MTFDPTQPPHERALQAAKSWSGYGEFMDAVACFKELDLFIAGGLMRDIYRGVVPILKDIDFFVSGADSNAFISELGRRGILSFGPFGAPRWTPFDPQDDVYVDVILISKFNNGLWPCEDIVDALNQFDFTANAIGLHVKSRTIIDPQHGVRDASRQIVRAVRFDFPDQPIPGVEGLTRLGVMWMRLLNYTNVLQMSMEPITRQWVLENRHYSEQVPLFSRIFFPPNVEMVGD